MSHCLSATRIHAGMRPLRPAAPTRPDALAPKHRLTWPGGQHVPPQHVFEAGHCTPPSQTWSPGATHWPFEHVWSPGQQRPPQPTSPAGQQTLPPWHVWPGGPVCALLCLEEEREEKRERVWGE